MGLDMYLERIPRDESLTPTQIFMVERVLDYQDKIIKDKSRASQYTLEQWCGGDDIPTDEVVEKYKPLYKTQYYCWDKDKKYPHKGIIEEVAYWRKANHIHKWFVDNIQDGIDDCDFHREVTEDDIKELLDVCHKVLDKCVLVNGNVSNGAKLVNGEWEAEYIDGMIIDNYEVAQELLPTSSGCFFGSCDYDEYYLRDISETIEMLTDILETTDFEKQMIFYLSSW